jgi:Fur family zinc uptake transcriptional regulator
MPISQKKIDKIIDSAEHNCLESGGKLTAKRKHVLTTLLEAETPLSAYEIADKYKEAQQETIPVMSVYRMLKFLMDENLVHKLSLTNKYLACSHIACAHSHEIPQFLICDECAQVSEVGIKKDIIEAMKNSVENTGFSLNSPQLELHGICKSCQSSEEASV